MLLLRTVKNKRWTVETTDYLLSYRNLPKACIVSSRRVIDTVMIVGTEVEASLWRDSLWQGRISLGVIIFNIHTSYPDTPWSRRNPVDPKINF